MGVQLGPDGLHGVFFKGLYTVVPTYIAEQDMWAMHVYDTSSGSVLGDMLELLYAAFVSSSVPVNWCGTCQHVLRRGTRLCLTTTGV